MVLKSKDDQVTVIGAGVTLHEALAAADLLKKGKKGERGAVGNGALLADQAFCEHESHLPQR